MATCLRLISSNASRSSAINLSSLTRSSWLKRGAHRARGLPYEKQKGLGKFLPPAALNTLVEYQEGLLERLNHELRTDPTIEKHSSVAQTAITYSSKRERTLGFNYAVLALNNSFFLDQLTPPPEDASVLTHEDKISRTLFNQIELNYGDITHLKSTFSAAAMGMFSNGWVWLVTDAEGNLGVLPTFGPSTLLVRSRQNMHYDEQLPILGEDSARHAAVTTAPRLPNADWASPTSPTSGVSAQKTTFKTFDFHSRTFSTTSKVSIVDLLPDLRKHNNVYGDPVVTGIDPKNTRTLLDTGKTLFPLFCLPVYEHAWLSAGYGVWGKEAWLREFWTVLDWSKVSNAYNVHTTPKLP